MRTTNIRLVTLPAIATISALSLLGISALAHGGHCGNGSGEHRDPAAFVKHFDQNGDGKLQITELPDRMKERLAPADTNKDGVLTTDELTLRFEAAKAERLAAMDANHDGKVSDEERAAAREAKQKEHFARMDKDGNGEVSEAEAGRFWEHLKVADANGSGGVSYTEMTDAIAAGKLHPFHGMGQHGHHHDEDSSNSKS